MSKYLAQIASEGVAIGRIFELQEKRNDLNKKAIENSADEKNRFTIARDKAIQQIDILCNSKSSLLSEINLTVFESHKMLLKDNGYNNSIFELIENEMVNAEYAVDKVSDKYVQIFQNLDEEYFKERAVDIRDIGNRIIDILCNRQAKHPEIKEECILVADDLTPSYTLKIDKSKVLAIVVRNGSINSHAAILARAMGIPALIGVKCPCEINGIMAVVDACKGKFHIDPNQERLEKGYRLQEKFKEKANIYEKYKGLKAVTKSGKSINLMANVGGIPDIIASDQHGASGIGLFRTEFIYLQEDNFPSEILQFAIYKKATQVSQGKEIIIRTLDVGSDKELPYFDVGHTANPALGLRGIRLCLKYEEIFRVQLKAILRAAVYGNISILLPLVNDVEEIKSVKKIIEDIIEEFEENEIPYSKCKIGIMIETPAAVLMMDELVEEADFFSIGTNDLTQFTLAVDREHAEVYAHRGTYHPAVMRMVKLVVKVAHSKGKTVGVCGELARDKKSIKRFLDFGVDMISISPQNILPITKMIREMK